MQQDMPPKEPKGAARIPLDSGRAANSPAPEAHQHGGLLFGTHQSVFTPQAQSNSVDGHARISESANSEDVHSQLASLREQVRILTSGSHIPHPIQNPTPPSPTSFYSFIQTSSPKPASSLGESFRPGSESRGGGMSSRGTHFSAGDLREILNPRKSVEEPRLLTVSIASAIEFLTKWHEHGASVLGTTTPTHLSLLIAPSALQTIADKNEVGPDTIMSSNNYDIVSFLAKAISFGKGPADAILSIASHCSLRRLNTSTFASFHIRFEILCFLFAPTSIPEKLLAKAFCSAIQNTRASSHLRSLDLRDWRTLALTLKQAILQREALDPIFGPHKDPEAITRADGLKEGRTPPRTSPPQSAGTPARTPYPQQAQPQRPVEPPQQIVQQQRQPAQSFPPPNRQSPHSASQTGGSTRFQPRSVAAHSAQTTVEPDDPITDEGGESPSSEESQGDE